MSLPKRSGLARRYQGTSMFRKSTRDRATRRLPYEARLTNGTTIL